MNTKKPLPETAKVF